MNLSEPKWLLADLIAADYRHQKNLANYRDELGSVQSSLSQLIFKDG